MSRRNKLQKFSDLLSFPHVYESFEFGDPNLTRGVSEKASMKGKWGKVHFGNDNPIHLELACGRGEYTLALAKRYPDKNFIGVDVKGARIWKGATQALEESITNVAFLRCRIEQLELFFDEGEVSEIWITFPDPFLKDRKQNRRLTSPAFLEKYKLLLTRDGSIHLKTDSPLLFDYSRETVSDFPAMDIVKSIKDIYAGPLPHPDLDICTYYEKQHLLDQRKIKYLFFKLVNPA